MKHILLSIATFLSFLQAHAYESAPQIKESKFNADSLVTHGTGVFITANFVWWKVIQEGLNYALTGIRSNPGTSLSGQGTERTPDFGWNPGFKVGLGVNLPYDSWDLCAQYTWLQGHNNDDQATSNNANLQEGFLLGSLTTSANVIRNITKAVTHWEFKFNVIDFEFARNFCVSQSLTLRPFSGLKLTWQSQDWNSTFIAQEVGIDNPYSNPPGYVQSQQDFNAWGIGVRTGLNGTWFFTKGWSLFANTALTAMWVDCDIDRKDIFHPNHVSNGTTVLNVHRDRDSIRAITELQLGLRREWWFSNDDYHLAFAVAYEQQVWINYGSYILMINSTTNDLSLQGLTIKTCFEF